MLANDNTTSFFVPFFILLLGLDELAVGDDNDSTLLRFVGDSPCNGDQSNDWNNFPKFFFWGERGTGDVYDDANVGE